MAPEEDREAILSALLHTIAKRREGHLDTGIFGTRYLATVLADHGHLDEALDILFHPTYPSFGDQIARGATTLWEQWVEVGSMATHNHAMFAGVCSLITEKLFGLVSSEDAYRTVTLRPVLAASVSELSITLMTLRGDYKLSYRRTEDALTLSLDVPFGCLATLLMPDGREYRLAHGKHTLTA
jgi:alpha-L-rhamnosidase